jgi:hypothetical protein
VDWLGSFNLDFLVYLFLSESACEAALRSLDGDDVVVRNNSLLSQARAHPQVQGDTGTGTVNIIRTRLCLTYRVQSLRARLKCDSTRSKTLVRS